MQNIFVFQDLSNTTALFSLVSEEQEAGVLSENDDVFMNIHLLLCEVSAAVQSVCQGKKRREEEEKRERGGEDYIVSSANLIMFHLG